MTLASMQFAERLNVLIGMTLILLAVLLAVASAHWHAVLRRGDPAARVPPVTDQSFAGRFPRL